MSEEQAFDTLKFLMYDLGIRRQYRPDMISLQVCVCMCLSVSVVISSELVCLLCLMCLLMNVAEQVFVNYNGMTKEHCVCRTYCLCLKLVKLLVK